jgi:hypothetical protein
MDMDEPIATKLKTDMAEPILIVARTERLEPMWRLPRMEDDPAPPLNLPRMEVEDPNRE